MTEKNLEDVLKFFVKFARKNGLKRLRSGDIEIELGEVKAPAKRVRVAKGQSVTDIPTDEMNEEEILNWSSGLE